MQTNLKNTVSLTSAHDQHKDKVYESNLIPYYKSPITVQFSLQESSYEEFLTYG